MIVNLRSFRQKARRSKSVFTRFLRQLEKNPPRGLDNLTTKTNQQVWLEVDCLSCANCCKTMTPTYTLKDIRRISSHLGMSMAALQKKWLRKEKGTGDWLNRSTPCQFLDTTTNMCGIYDVRPADCAGFPHLTKRKMVEYMHVHKQNIDLCPATFKMVERMMREIDKSGL
jgi:Fe-S-cluster containining protein